MSINQVGFYGVNPYYGQKVIQGSELRNFDNSTIHRTKRQNDKTAKCGIALTMTAALALIFGGKIKNIITK